MLKYLKVYKDLKIVEEMADYMASGIRRQFGI